MDKLSMDIAEQFSNSFYKMRSSTSTSGTSRCDNATNACQAETQDSRRKSDPGVKIVRLMPKAER